jgi:signal transduction histidine kinase
MLGISEDWIDIGNRRFVPFSGLQPGEYVFNVKGSNNDGVWNNTPASLKILVLPPWYRSVYAYIFYLFLLFASILTFIKLRERKLVRDKKNLEQKVHERTLRIEKQNQMIVSKNAELEELNYTKDKLFSIIGHDLGNQFNIILGFLDVLVSNFKKLDQAKVETHLHNINNSSKQAYNLLENLLTWARMQTNQIQFNPEKLEVKTKITDSVKLFEGACARKTIRIEVKDFEEIMVVADENMFSTVFRNIVSNAVKFTPENGSIIIFAERKNGYCKITIQDNGVGISKEDLTKIFKIGSKHRTRGTQGEKGTGLGLVLCKEFVEKQGGYLTVKSKEGKGSQFSFTLPLAKSHDPLSV